MSRVRVKRRAPVRRKRSIWANWRHFAAYVYLMICIFDFVLMPVYYEVAHGRLDEFKVLHAIQTLPEVTQVEALKIMTTEARWIPLTLGETGLFHIAFGAILGVAAWTRGNEKIARARRGDNYDHYDCHESGEEEELEDEPLPPEEKK